MANAGRVAIVPKGEYNSATSYKRLDLVRYNNAVYVAKKANTGVSPTKTDTWMLCIQNVTQEQYDDLISGAVQVESAKEADNALLLENLTAEQVGESGARNLIPYLYRDTTNVVGGITFTDNGDGSVTVNGTATAFAQFYFCTDITMGLKPNTTYTLTGCPSGGSGNTYQLRAILNHKLDNPATAVDVGNGKTFTTPDGYSFIRIMIDVFKGATIENLTFKPMLEIGSVAHDFVPYHFGGAEDSLKLNGLTAEEFVSNENLLVNGYFKDPVNLSRLTKWSGIKGTTIAGWDSKQTDVTVELLDSGLKIISTSKNANWVTFQHHNTFPLKAGKYAISAKVVDMHGIWYIGGANIGNHRLNVGENSSIYENSTDQNSASLYLWTTSGDGTNYVILEWIKLEPGSIATPFIPPNKEVEKLKCGIVDSSALTFDLLTTKKNLGIPLVIPTGYTGYTAPENEGWFKIFEVSTVAWHSYAIDMTIEPSNLINNSFFSTGLTLSLKCNSTGKMEPRVHLKYGDGSILDKFYVVQNDDSTTDSFEVWYKNNAAWSDLTVILYSPNSRGRDKDWNDITVNQNATTPLDTTTEGKNGVYCFSDVLLLSTEAKNADTVDGKHAHDFLLTTGGTATGALGTNTRFARYVTHYEKGTIPSSHVWNDGVVVYDKNGAVLGGVQNAVYTNGSSVTRLIAEQLVDGVSVGSVISAEVTADGEIFGTAPTPASATDNSIKIATTAWVNKFALPLTGTAAKATADANGKNIAETYLTKTGTAAKATADANGKNIASTYKTKAESVNVKISTSAPSDTSAVWVDTANKVTKIYKDGAWTALA